MNIVKATTRYERWLASHTPLVKADLRLKHQQMATAVFPFLRATFYRWVKLWPEVCPDLAKAPKILAVGDLHVENYGTWRDVEGRLVWGVNDFDEAAVIPFALHPRALAQSARRGRARRGGPRPRARPRRRGGGDPRRLPHRPPGSAADAPRRAGAVDAPLRRL